MRTLIKDKQVGITTTSGTEWPRVKQLHRQQWHGKTSWSITKVCNGIAESYKEYKTKKAALADF